MSISSQLSAGVGAFADLKQTNGIDEQMEQFQESSAKLNAKITSRMGNLHKLNERSTAQATKFLKLQEKSEKMMKHFGA